MADEVVGETTGQLFEAREHGIVQRPIGKSYRHVDENWKEFDRLWMNTTRCSRVHGHFSRNLTNSDLKPTWLTRMHGRFLGNLTNSEADCVSSSRDRGYLLVFVSE